MIHQLGRGACTTNPIEGRVRRKHSLWSYDIVLDSFTDGPTPDGQDMAAVAAVLGLGIEGAMIDVGPEHGLWTAMMSVHSLFEKVLAADTSRLVLDLVRDNVEMSGDYARVVVAEVAGTKTVVPVDEVADRFHVDLSLVKIGPSTDLVAVLAGCVNTMREREPLLVVPAALEIPEAFAERMHRYQYKFETAIGDRWRLIYTWKVKDKLLNRGLRVSQFA